MSTLFEISGEKRGRAILNAVHIVVAKEQRPTVETVHAELPEAMFPGFDADPPGQDEIDAAMALIDQQAAEHVQTLEATAPAEPAADSQEPQSASILHDNKGEAPTLAPDQAREYLRLANIALAKARAAVTTATNKRTAARGRLADAVAAWQTGLPKMTREQAVRESIASFQQDRKNRVEGTPGPSVVDRQAFYSKGGTGADFARKQFRGGGYHRGAFPASARGARVPSER